MSTDIKYNIIKWFITHNEDLYLSMKSTTHDHSDGTLNPYHLEGSIWEHTLMVIAKSNNDINHVFASLLHDIGKTKTRVEKENGKVSFYNHENLSTYMSIDILKSAIIEFPNLDIIKVLKFVAWHGKMWSKNMEESDNLKLINLRFGNDLNFYYDFLDFISADAFGRVFEDEIEELILMEKVEFLKNLIPYDPSEYKIKPKNELIMMIGLSGSGKSTYIDKNIDLNNYKLLSLDNNMSKSYSYNNIDYKKSAKKAHDKLTKELLECVKAEKNCVIDMTNLDIETRRKKLSKFPVSKYHKKAIVFLTGEKLIFTQSQRKGKNIPKEVIETQMLKFELANYDEFDEIEYIF